MLVPHRQQPVIRLNHHTLARLLRQRSHPTHVKNQPELLRSLDSFFNTLEVQQVLHQRQRNRGFDSSCDPPTIRLRGEQRIERHHSHPLKELLQEVLALKRNVASLVQREEQHEILVAQRATHLKNHLDLARGQEGGLQRPQERVGVDVLLGEEAVQELIARELQHVLRRHAVRVQLLQLRLTPVELVHVVLLVRVADLRHVLEGEARVVFVYFDGEVVVNVLHLFIRDPFGEYGQVLSYGPQLVAVVVIRYLLLLHPFVQYLQPLRQHGLGTNHVRRRDLDLTPRTTPYARETEVVLLHRHHRANDGSCRSACSACDP